MASFVSSALVSDTYILGNRGDRFAPRRPRANEAISRVLETLYTYLVSLDNRHSVSFKHSEHIIR